MSVNILEVGLVKITSFWGGEKYGKSLQFTIGTDYAQLTRKEVLEVKKAIDKWLDGSYLEEQK
jgi:hypothetical protein